MHGRTSHCAQPGRKEAQRGRKEAQRGRKEAQQGRKEAQQGRKEAHSAPGLIMSTRESNSGSNLSCSHVRLPSAAPAVQEDTGPATRRAAAGAGVLARAPGASLSEVD